jgi:hypothetical protein
MAATPSPNLADQSALAADPTFQSRVLQAMISTCFQVVNEAITTATQTLHLKRSAFATQTLTNILSNSSVYGVFFARSVATDTPTINAATVNGTVPLTSSPIAAAQAALIPDSAITTALSSQFNSFFTP